MSHMQTNLRMQWPGAPKQRCKLSVAKGFASECEWRENSLAITNAMAWCTPFGSPQSKVPDSELQERI